MRTFTKLYSDFWINYDNSELIRLGAEAQLMALYLLGNSHHNILGVYYLPLLYISSDLRLPVKKVQTRLRKLISINYCKYDTKTQYVWVCNLALDQLGKDIDTKKKDGKKNRTVNSGLQVVRHILNLAASEWIDNNNITWLGNIPKIKLLPISDARKPCPLNWEEQEGLFNELPIHLRRMALFAVNTGCRDQEICSLRWEWEMKIPELCTSVFIIPGVIVKNSEDRLVVLNKIALSVINEVRGQHSEYVFTYRGKPTSRMLNSAWVRARKKTNFAVRVHDLKHTFGRRLRAAGVSFEDRQDLLGHKSGRITTHYSAAEIGNLITAANKVCETIRDINSSTLTLLRCKNAGINPVQINLEQAYVRANLYEQNETCTFSSRKCHAN